MKTIVAGSRAVMDTQAVFEAVRESGFEITEVVSGGAVGVDRLGEHWAVRNRVPICRFPVTAQDWKEKGRQAGMLRNLEMALYADALIAIWDGQSKGTKHMIDAMRRLNKPYHIKIFGGRELDVQFSQVAGVRALWKEFTASPLSRDKVAYNLELLDLSRLDPQEEIMVKTMRNWANQRVAGRPAPSARLGV